MLTLTILGSGTHKPVANRSNPAYLLDINGETVLIDCGSGTLRQIAKIRRSEWEISKIFLSHLHIDHTIDLVPLLFTYKYQRNIEMEKQLSIFAHPDFSERLSQLEKIYGRWIQSDKIEYNHIPMTPNQQRKENFKIETFSAQHSKQSLIYKFIDSNNQAFVYSGDTSLTEDLIRATYSADLALVECSSQEKPKLSGHMSPKEINILIKESKIKKIVITHIHPSLSPPNILRKIDSNDTEVIIAQDLQKITSAT